MLHHTFLLDLSQWEDHADSAVAGLKAQLIFWESSETQPTRVVEDHPSKVLSCNGHLGHATIVPIVCLVAFAFKEGDNDNITKVVLHDLYLLYARQDIVECIQGLRSSSHEDFSRKAINSRCSANASLLDCFLDFNQSGWKIKSITAFCGIKSLAAGSTVMGLLSQMEKCSPHCSIILPLSLSRVVLSEESKGVVLGCQEPYRALRELKNALKLLLLVNCWNCLPCCPTNYPVFFRVPTGLCSSGTWLWCYIILPFYKGIAFFFLKLVDLLIVLIELVLVNPFLWPKDSFFPTPLPSAWTGSTSHLYLQSVVHEHAVCH